MPDRTKTKVTATTGEKCIRKLKEQITETTQYYSLRNVHPRAEQPFQVRDDGGNAGARKHPNERCPQSFDCYTKSAEEVMRSCRGTAAMPLVKSLVWRLFPLSSVSRSLLCMIGFQLKIEILHSLSEKSFTHTRRRWRY